MTNAAMSKKRKLTTLSLSKRRAIAEKMILRKIKLLSCFENVTEQLEMGTTGFRNPPDKETKPGLMNDTNLQKDYSEKNESQFRYRLERI